MSNIIVDVEADGPCPGLYSMVSFGAVCLHDPSKTFYAQLAPISNNWIADALAVSGHTRLETLQFTDPKKVMTDFNNWIMEVTPKGRRPLFWSDNNGFDWQFINYYFHAYYGSNPFGHSSKNIGDLYKGIVRDVTKNFKHLRKTKHTHHPVDDATGNVEAIIAMKTKYNLKLPV